MNQKIRNILDFWFVETPTEKRFKKDPKFDDLIKEKFFSLLPFIHSENINDHEKLYKLMDQHLKDHLGIKDIKKFWTDHTKAIRKFSRYHHRNKVLGRKSTPEEIEFLKQPNSSW